MLTLLGESGQSPFENLAIASWRLYPKVAEELREQTGIDVEHVTRGTIYPLFTAEDVLHAEARAARHPAKEFGIDRKSTRLNSSHQIISYAVLCLKKKIK